jgi:hypothetical protein
VPPPAFRPVEETIVTRSRDRTVDGDRPTLAHDKERSLGSIAHRITREPQRGRYDRETIDLILDQRVATSV